ncbi:hypothetical protein ASE61_13495 [Bosea sp. Root670]|uniref:hypothetical protein n=1 Tax=Bosea sp. Root670 TaxID=1736583 RepID=UPI0007158FA0|nr:hypothetical protein [Bosea sp. Root670]KRE03473.1 hypothetical protein ASE61_13495 [Bosea sp. Root670]
MTAQWPHQVELKLDKVSAAERLRRIEAWCSDWQIGFRVLGTMSEGVIRVAFERARFARAFHAHFGGVIAPGDELEAALAADAAEVDLYDRLAGEYPD